MTESAEDKKGEDGQVGQPVGSGDSKGIEECPLGSGNETGRSGGAHGVGSGYDQSHRRWPEKADGCRIYCVVSADGCEAGGYAEENIELVGSIGLMSSTQAGNRILGARDIMLNCQLTVVLRDSIQNASQAT